MDVRDFSETARGGTRIVCIYLFLALAFILNLANIPLLGNGIIRPDFLMIGVYFWTISKPSLLPLPVIFAVALLFDIASASVMGLHAFSFMLIVLLIHNQRRFLHGQSWLVLWAGFGVAALILASVQIIVAAIQSGKMPSPWLFGANIGINMLAFPVLMPLMHGLNRFLAPVKHDY